MNSDTNLLLLGSTHRSIIKLILTSEFDFIKNLQYVDYGFHTYNCDCAQIKVIIEDSKKLNRFLDSTFIELVEVNSSDQKVEIIFNISLKTSIVRFRDLYKDVIPKALEISNLGLDYKKLKESNHRKMRIFLYKEKTIDDIKYELITTAKGKFCLNKLNYKGITHGMTFKPTSFIWRAEGIGCLCSELGPIYKSEIDKEILFDLIKESFKVHDII